MRFDTQKDMAVKEVLADEPHANSTASTLLTEAIVALPVSYKLESVLLSWFLLLLRSNETASTFEWTSACENGMIPREAIHTVDLQSVIANLDQSIERASSFVAKQLSASESAQAAFRSPSDSVVLSSHTLTQNDNEESIHIRVSHEANKLVADIVWKSKSMLDFAAGASLQAFLDIATVCETTPHVTIRDALRPMLHDLDAIWNWNAIVPPTYSYCMHEVFTEIAAKYADKVALHSWDGDLTYGQIEQYSNNMAFQLTERGVMSDTVVPICSEKSKWATVAVLAVMKAGATFAMLDPTLPLARLQIMVNQVQAKIMLSTHKQEELSRNILQSREIVIVGDEALYKHPHTPNLRLSAVSPDTTMYIIFTSGSTGTPKGVQISHRTYSSSAVPRAATVGYVETSRVLDFASYAFDVSIDSMLLTLANGGCLCIPSDEDRLNDINRVMRDMRINYAGLTPSVARILDHDVITSLEMLGLGGEAVSARDVNLWGRNTRIVIGYGPCECTIGCTVNGDAATGRNYISIGKGSGANMWIVDPDDHDKLVPLGAVGELLVEGPIVGQGYLNDPDKTSAVFIDTPKWLAAGHNGHAGRHGCLYKTGDLGKWDPDGSGGIVFADRKDTQVKLRGQRVELGEIESHLKDTLPSGFDVIAEVIAPKSGGSQPMLVAFIAPKSPKKNHAVEIELRALKPETQRAISNAESSISRVLPRYMVPCAFVPINEIPVLISGKTDRKRLREFGTLVDLRQVEFSSTSDDEQINEKHSNLRKCWATLLSIAVDDIRTNDNFFALGGDSVMAMKLVSVCRGAGMLLSVRDTFDYPTLTAMSEIAQELQGSSIHTDIAPFSLVPSFDNALITHAAEVCSVQRDAVEDIYPCSATQEALFTFSLKSLEPYTAQRIARIPSHVDTESWKTAWNKLVQSIAILRTRVVQLDQSPLLQVVVKENINWKTCTSLERYLQSDRDERMELGDRLARYAIVKDQRDHERYMIWTIHHVVYDGWSEPLLLQQVADILAGQEPQVAASMKHFIKFNRDMSEQNQRDFWREELAGAVGPQYPLLPSRDYLPTSKGFLERTIALDTAIQRSFTLATLLRGALAIVISQHSENHDVVFGETLSGRDIALTAVEDICGPLIATVPFRVTIDRMQTTEAYLQAVQQTMLKCIPYQHLGMQNIRKVSSDAQFACETGTGIVIQPEVLDVATALGFDQGDPVLEALHFNPYPLMLAFGLQKNGFRVCANYDEALISGTEMSRFLEELQTICKRMCSSLSSRVGDLSCLPDAEVNRIWSFNARANEVLQRYNQERKTSSRLPFLDHKWQAIPWVCHRSNTSLLTPLGCVGDLWLEVDVPTAKWIDPPGWLRNGSIDYSGRETSLCATGDMVKLEEDGHLTYIRRKDDLALVDGHALDLEDLERVLGKQVDQQANIICVQRSIMSSSTTQLIVFVQPQQLHADTFGLLEQDFMIQTSVDQPVSGVIPSQLAASTLKMIRKMDRYARRNFPSFMVPSFYVPFEMLNFRSTKVDRRSWTLLLEQLDSATIFILQSLLPKLWSSIDREERMSDSEEVLAKAWSQVLQLDIKEIEPEDNFFRKGGDSVLAMKLSAELRTKGYALTVAEIFRHMRLQNAAKVMKFLEKPPEDAAQYQVFSTLNAEEVEQLSSGELQSLLQDTQWTVQDMYPITDSQKLDVDGTIRRPCTSIQYTMLFFDNDISSERLLQAVRQLIANHDILRTVFIKPGPRVLQAVLNNLDVPVSQLTTDDDLRTFAHRFCKRDIEQPFALGAPFVRLFHVLAPQGKHCLLFGLSHALYDGVSLPRLLQDLEALYNGNDVQLYQPFSRYISQSLDVKFQGEAVKYWRQLLQGSSLTMFERSSNVATDRSVFLDRSIGPPANPADITRANMLTAAWALVLFRRTGLRDITFGSITSGRNIGQSYLDSTVGPCYQFTPVRVVLQDEWTSAELLQHVQRQSAESAAHDFLGFTVIAEKCTSWGPKQTFFDSIVHHQDLDDIDSMAFAGVKAGVNISNPHGDASFPWKAVSFVRAGDLHIGVVAGDRDEQLAGTILDELEQTYRQLVQND